MCRGGQGSEVSSWEPVSFLPQCARLNSGQQVRLEPAASLTSRSLTDLSMDLMFKISSGLGVQLGGGEFA